VHRLVCYMLAIITNLHLTVVVDDALDVWGINHILCSMVKHMHNLSSKEGIDAQRRLVLKNG
jgi:hypothetical protein